MFKVRARVVGFRGNEKKHPCHFRYQIGDEVVYDGEKFVGRVCPSIMRPLSEKMSALYSSGGRHREGEVPGQYLPFWHSPISVLAPENKKYDGVGFKPLREIPEDNYKYVPDVTLFDRPGKVTLKGGPGTGKREKVTLVCGDNHTLMEMEIEAFDLVDYGDGLPYSRRALSILNKISKKPGIAVNKIIREFEDDERDNIYPTLCQNIIWALVGELTVLDYITLDENHRATITKKGEEKLASFKKSLSAEEKKALRM